MAAIASITIADGVTPTAVNHVFQPIQTNPAQYKRTGVADQPAAAMERVQANLKQAAGTNGLNTVDLVLALPVLEQTSGGTSSGYVAPPSIAHEMKAKVTFYLHGRSVVAGRRDLRVMLSNLLKDPQIIDLIDNLTPPN